MVEEIIHVAILFLCSAFTSHSFNDTMNSSPGFESSYLIQDRTLSPSCDMIRSATAWPCQMYIRHAPEKSGGQEREVGDRSPMMGRRERQRGEIDMKLLL